MKKVIITSVIFAMVVGLGISFAEKPQDPVDGYNGNGAPSGPHFNLNIIGVEEPKNVDPVDGGNNGHRMFVLLDGRIRILLQEGPFAVIDYDGTDGTAKFQLPKPDPENDGITVYSVFVRGLGSPQGNPHADIEPGFIDEFGNEWYSVETVTVQRKRGQSKFVNVSKELLYVYVDMDLNGVPERYPLFSNELWQFFWDYNNKGLKLCQLRFYEIETNVN